MQKRINLFRGLIGGSFVILAIGLGHTQLIKGPEYFRLSEQNRIRLIPMSAPRGIIYDRNGFPIASNRLVFDIVIIPQELKDKNASISNLSRLINMSKDEIDETFKKNYFAPFAPVVVKKDVDKRIAFQVEENKLLLPGIFIQTRPKRNYNYPESTSHLIGYLGEINREELKYLKVYGYKIKDLIGRSGIERALDSELRGESGGMQIEVDNRGKFAAILGQKEPLKGKDLSLTIDARLQDFAYEQMGDFSGACIVMDVNTGEILTLISKPGFDPESFQRPGNRSEVSRILRSKRKPLFNRAVLGLYQPASVFKVVVAVAALESKKINSYTTFTCQGRFRKGNMTFDCWKPEGHSSLDLVGAIANSCNVYFYNLAEMVGPDLIAKYATKFGFGKATQIELIGETAGLVPTKMWKLLTKGERWYRGETLNLAIGHGYLLATPIQVARFISMVANGGSLIQPYLVKKDSSKPQGSQSLKIADSTMSMIKKALSDVVDKEYGTGRNARVEGLIVSGKTGTAEQNKGRSHSWFVGFAPYRKPQYSVLVFLEHGGSGGGQASTIASKIFKRMKEMELL